MYTPNSQPGWERSHIGCRLVLHRGGMYLQRMRVSLFPTRARSLWPVQGAASNAKMDSGTGFDEMEYMKKEDTGEHLQLQGSLLGRHCGLVSIKTLQYWHMAHQRFQKFLVEVMFTPISKQETKRQDTPKDLHFVLPVQRLSHFSLSRRSYRAGVPPRRL